MRILTWLTVILGLLSLAAPASAQQKKNVVLIIADDLGRDLQCYGNDVIKMPNLDGLAKKGVRFMNAYSSVASCSPSRACLLTGLYTHQSGQYGLQHSSHNQVARPGVQSLANLLRMAGYFTGLIGKFHVGPSESYNFHYNSARGTKGNRDVRVMAKLAEEFMQKRAKQPFFLVYSFSDPHRRGDGFANELFPNDPDEVKYDPAKVILPYHLPDQPQVRAQLAEYYQSATRMDRGVGLLLKVLEMSGQLDNTLIIFVSDNGIPFPGAKTTLYRAGTHLPLIMAGPGVPRNHENDTLVSYNDIAPTILDWAKAKGPKYKLPGKSLLPILDAKDAKGWDEVYGSHQFHEITMYYPMRSITTRKYRYIVNIAPQLDYPFASDLWASPTWQYVRKTKAATMGKVNVETFLHRPKEELYNITKDPNELHNLADNPQYAKVLEDLRGRVRRWRIATDDPWTILFREEDPKFNR